MNDLSTPAGRASAPARARRRSPGTANRAPYRNEVRARLDDPTYEALLFYQRLHGIESVSSAMARALKGHLLGMVGMLPAEISGVSAHPSQVETGI
ncbi:hypothetical protein BCh11DRAFT_06451 [Burkholderia sp. Ch1-1]|nr:hypothetical protein BCh11DRAFT_06451 [Burkholderia sp. Ch1-1]